MKGLKEKLKLPLSASLKERGGTISCVVSYKDTDGKYKTKWLSTGCRIGTSERELNKKVKELVTEFYEQHMREKYSDTSGSDVNNCESTSTIIAANTQNDKTFHQLVDEWELHKKRRNNLAESTLNGYAKINRQIKKYFSADMLVKELTTDDIISFYDDRQDSGNNGTTIRKYHIQIKSILNYAVKKGYIIRNVAPDSEDVPKINNFQSNYCTVDELYELIAAFKGDRMELPLILTAYYGFRRSEVCGLKWSAIDFDNNTISVNHIMTNSFDNGEKCVGVDRCKSEKSRRTLPLFSEIKVLLLEKRDQEQKFKRLCGDSWNDEFEGYICRDDVGNLITPEFVSTHFRYMIKKIGFKHIRFHDLRHSCASIMLKNEVEYKKIQEWLGHASIVITVNTQYGHTHRKQPKSDKKHEKPFYTARCKISMYRTVFSFK